jgi:hypothetical protein
VSRPTVEIRFKDGRLLSRKVDCVPGNPLSKNIDTAIALIDDLENATDVAEITRLLTPELAA